MTTPLVPQFKAKIPGYLSYPLSSTLISEQIVPFAKDYPFCFSFSDGHVPKKNSEIVNPYSVARLSYRYIDPKRISHSMIGTLYGESHWDLTLNAVLRIQRKKIMELFDAEGIERLQQWLKEPRTPIWFGQTHSFSIQYIPLEGRFAYEIGG